MSRPLRTKEKDLVNLRVVTADEVWTKNKGGKMVLRKDINIFGRIDKGNCGVCLSLIRAGMTSFKASAKLTNSCKVPIFQAARTHRR